MTLNTTLYTLEELRNLWLARFEPQNPRIIASWISLYSEEDRIEVVRSMSAANKVRTKAVIDILEANGFMIPRERLAFTRGGETQRVNLDGRRTKPRYAGQRRTIENVKRRLNKEKAREAAAARALDRF